uniref:Brain my034 protein n=1 Tax=Homo sapiens TaxID=9606 RepID=Q9H3J2_HUMAN|nr:brain my034 protein [Homo sapiens]
MVSSVVGFYSLRFFGNFTPKKDDTTMTKIIGNCVSILVLSSALPVMSRTLGLHKLHLPNTSRDSETASVMTSSARDTGFHHLQALMC